MELSRACVHADISCGWEKEVTRAWIMGIPGGEIASIKNTHKTHILYMMPHLAVMQTRPPLAKSLSHFKQDRHASSANPINLPDNIWCGWWVFSDLALKCCGGNPNVEETSVFVLSHPPSYVSLYKVYIHVLRLAFLCSVLIHCTALFCTDCIPV